ncbi:MAG: hypothetical protein E7639_03225 [Ruminococcaceae bacterium]|nr:hypothetical protein [Oscillospiraceae bacterium]
MKKVLSLLLCIVMLASLAVLFSSCGGGKEVDFTDYRLVYGSDMSDTGTEEVKTFADALSKKTGEKIGVKKVNPTSDTDEGDELEILVGNTNRPETAKALKKIKGHGYIVTVIGSKVVVVGTTNLLTLVALDFFTETYLGGEESLTMKIATEKQSKMEMLEFDNKWSFIHASDLNGIDQINMEIQESKKILDGIADLNASVMVMQSDTESREKEILVGLVNRDAAKELNAVMTVVEYGVAIKDGKIILPGLNDAMTVKSLKYFRDVVRDSVCEADDKKTVAFPTSFTRIYTDTESIYVTDFPKPEGLTLGGSVDVHQGLEYYYECTDATAYNTYCTALVSAGYTLFSDNTAEGSIFRIYNNTEKNITLYVAYNDFAHAAEQGLGHKKAIRIVASRLDAVNQVSPDELTMGTFEKIQDASITTIKLDYAKSSTDEVFGNLFIVALEDGSFVLLDGALALEADRERIYHTLLDLYKQAHGGNDPTQNDPIRIAAWYLSHGHNDHYGAVQMFIKKYAADFSRYKITVDRLIANFGSDDEMYNCEDGGRAPNQLIRNTYTELSALVKDTPGEKAGFDYIKVHTGQRFWLASTEFEVLYTHEDQYPNRIHVYNNTSTVIRMNMYSTNGTTITEGSKTSMLWLGDAQEDASKFMRASWGSYLKSDIVQVAHHGWHGCEWQFYQLVAPTAALWPNSMSSWKKYFHANTGGNVGNGCSYKIIYNLTSLQHIIVCDTYNYNITVTATGANFEPYNATSNPKGVRSVGVGYPNFNSSRNVERGTVAAKNRSYMTTKYYTAP